MASGRLLYKLWEAALELENEKGGTYLPWMLKVTNKGKRKVAERFPFQGAQQGKEK